MQRMNKVKEAKRRARQHQHKTVRIQTTAKVVPDRRQKLLERSKRKDTD